LEIGKKNDRVITVTAAMTDGTGLGKFASRFPERFYDVGIAEEHAVSFSSGLASQGFRPVAAIYSTFLQRAYDQIVHDVCLNKLPVVFCIDRAGIVGEDGATHHGVFDISFLRQMPNMVLMAPADGRELRSMLEFAVAHDGPVALRYPKSGIPESEIENKGLELGKGQLVCESEVESPKSKILIVSTGSMVYPSVEAAKMLNDSGIAVSVINARFIKPLDRELILGHCKGKDLVVTVEEGGLAGGFGSSVMELMEESSVKVPVKRIGVPDQFVGHGKRDQLLKELGLDAEGITGFVKKEIGA